MKLAILSCGRSDYSIYLPLLKRLKKDSAFDIHVIAFGTHVSDFYGKTVSFFKDDDIKVKYEVESLILGDSSEAISTAMGLTAIKFSSIWAAEDYDLIIVLGDRYEMFAAVASIVPFNIPVAHIGGGETTFGAIDEKFRHSITCFSSLHFASTRSNAKRVSQIINSEEGVYNVGALGLDNLHDINLMSKAEFLHKWDIDLNNPTILTTYHPETVNLSQNSNNTDQLLDAIDNTDKQFVITMPNNDTMGTMIRNKLNSFAKEREGKIFLVEVLGNVGYYSCMKHCEFVLGNSSSGIVEAASFGKYVINVGNRQLGRESGSNVLHVQADAQKISSLAHEIEGMPVLGTDNIYGNGTASNQIIQVLKNYE